MRADIATIILDFEIIRQVVMLTHTPSLAKPRNQNLHHKKTVISRYMN
jgi:hypothetical protein